MHRQEIQILNDWGDILAVHKPAGWLSIPGRNPNAEHSVLSNLLGEQLREGKKQQGKDLFIIHRLDQGTSGVILFARTPAAHKELSTLFETREVKKTYWCMVAGIPAAQTIDAPIFKIPSKKIRCVVDPKGKPSQTAIKVLASHEGFSLVEASPLTGRTHQIRVHLAHLGFPILGDKLYGGVEKIHQIPLAFPLLHARQIEFTWPVGEHRLSVAPLTETFLQVCKSFGFITSC